MKPEGRGVKAGCRRKSVAALMLAIALVGVGAATAQAKRSAGAGALERLIFAPELVIAHQKEIGLTAEQKAAVIREMQQMQSELVPLQIEMAEAAELLGSLLRERQVNEEEAITAARAVMQLEAEVKSRHLRLVVRIKNLLSPEQQTTLRQIRARRRAQRTQ